MDPVQLFLRAVRSGREPGWRRRVRPGSPRVKGTMAGPERRVGRAARLWDAVPASRSERREPLLKVPGWERWRCLAVPGEGLVQ
jgi:hypothetical protein